MSRVSVPQPPQNGQQSPMEQSLVGFEHQLSPRTERVLRTWLLFFFLADFKYFTQHFYSSVSHYEDNFSYLSYYSMLFFFLAEAQSSHAQPSISLSFLPSPLCCAFFVQKSYQITLNLSHTVTPINTPLIHTPCHGLLA